jgi:hypothetical protein
MKFWLANRYSVFKIAQDLGSARRTMGRFERISCTGKKLLIIGVKLTKWFIRWQKFRQIPYKVHWKKIIDLCKSPFKKT